MRVLLALAVAAPLLMAGCTEGQTGPPATVHFMVVEDDVDGDGEEDFMYRLFASDEDGEGVRLDGTMVAELRRPLGHSACLAEDPKELVATKHIVLRGADGVASKMTGISAGGERRTVTVIEYTGLLADGHELDLDATYDVTADLHLAGGLRFKESALGFVRDGDAEAGRRPLDATANVTHLHVNEADFGSGRALDVTGGNGYDRGCAFTGRFTADLWPEDGEDGSAPAARVDTQVAWSDFASGFSPSLEIPVPSSLPSGFYRYEASVQLGDGRRIADSGSLLFY